MTTIEAELSGRMGTFRLDAAMTVPARGITALVGPSGCGKTTLLRCLAGLARMPGRVVVKDTVWQDGRRFLPPHRRPIGFVFQEPSLLPHLSVRDNLLFGFRRSGGAGVSKIAMDEVISLLGVEALLPRSTSRLSGGERQRIAIGRALLSQPELLLMDEPVSSLDPDSKAEILPYLERLHQALAIPVIYVSHDWAEVARLADRVLLMRDGRIAQPKGVEASTVASDEAAARRDLGAFAEDRIARLAVAALVAGLEPVASLSPPPG